MSGIQPSYKLSELPENLMLSPKYLMDWWDGVINYCGPERALDDKTPDFKLARELWVAAVFACCKRLTSDKEHWVSVVSDNAPDALVAYFDVDDIGAGRQIYQIEVTEFDNNASSLEDVLKNKLDMAYHPTTRIVCYVTRTRGDFSINLPNLIEFVSDNNPRNYEVWLLGGFTPKKSRAVNPLKMFCLTTGEDYQIDLEKEKKVANSGDAVWVPSRKSVNKEGKLTPLGKITLEFPEP